MTVTVNVLALAAAWIASGLLGSGFCYAYFQREYSVIADICRRADTFFALSLVLAGPFNLATAIVFMLASKAKFRHGWLFPGMRP